MRDALKLSEGNFAEAIGAGSRDTVAKWVSKNPQEPSFTHTRRIVTIAPTALVRLFVGEKGLDLETHVYGPERSKPNGTRDHRIRESHHVPSVQAEALAEALDEIDDRGKRLEVLTKCLNLIAEARHPSQLGAGQRPGRVQRK